jgi:glycosyltransferase involved in cell wall biosynthesis
MEPVVSICIPTYNGARWLRNCIASAQACSVACEIIVVDDGSSDSTVAVANELAASDNRIRVLVNPVNLGLVGNWNRCLELASGKWIKFLFQDDLLGEQCIERMVSAAGDTGVIVAARRNYVFVANTSKEAREYYTEQVRTLDKVAPDETRFTADRISRLAAHYPSVNFIGEPSTVIFQRELIQTLGIFDTQLKQLCDLEFWLRLASQHGLVYEPHATVDFMIHDDSMSSQNAGGRNFISTYLDPIRVVSAQLNGKQYQTFRSNISSETNKRLQMWLELRCYEAKKNARTAEHLQQIETFFLERPELRRAASSMKTKLLFGLLQLKRKFR